MAVRSRHSHSHAGNQCRHRHGPRRIRAGEAGQGGRGTWDLARFRARRRSLGPRLSRAGDRAAGRRRARLHATSLLRPRRFGVLRDRQPVRPLAAQGRDLRPRRADDRDRWHRPGLGCSPLHVRLSRPARRHPPDPRRGPGAVGCRHPLHVGDQSPLCADLRSEGERRPRRHCRARADHAAPHDVRDCCSERTPGFGGGVRLRNT
jgi:hypothetical protein